MKERSENILNATVEGFIKIGEPISSGWLYRNHNFGIKPAMIRLELDDLTDAGYLDQPYHSAGRIPSDRGYEFFTTRILGDDSIKFSSQPKFENLMFRSDWPDFLEHFSDQLGILSVLVDNSDQKIYKNGLDVLFEKISGYSREKIQEVIKDFEELDSRVEIFDDAPSQEDINIFIGTKSPITECPELSVITQHFNDNHQHFTLMAIGPKRMDYKKIVGAFKGLKNNKTKIKPKNGGK
ncbi:MAG: hypothetical protein WCX12_01350 [Candidatus Paceibacterota bacterium]|jgi:transcriptional regulator of heat shock response